MSLSPVPTSVHHLSISRWAALRRCLLVFWWHQAHSRTRHARIHIPRPQPFSAVAATCSWLRLSVGQHRPPPPSALHAERPTVDLTLFFVPCASNKVAAGRRNAGVETYDSPEDMPRRTGGGRTRTLRSRSKEAAISQVSGGRRPRCCDFTGRRRRIIPGVWLLVILRPRPLPDCSRSTAMLVGLRVRRKEKQKQKPVEAVCRRLHH